MVWTPIISAFVAFLNGLYSLLPVTTLVFGTGAADGGGDQSLDHSLLFYTLQLLNSWDHLLPVWDAFFPIMSVFTLITIGMYSWKIVKLIMNLVRGAGT